jgi:hypothetical protein
MKTIEERLKSKGITKKTKHHNYDYLYNSVVQLMQEYEEELYDCREQLQADMESINQMSDMLEEQRKL